MCADSVVPYALLSKSSGGCSSQLVNEASLLFDMRGCAGRRSRRCTPQLAAAQHMQADVEGGVRVGKQGLQFRLGLNAHVRVMGRCCARVYSRYW